jgi:hypothetical protein
MPHIFATILQDPYQAAQPTYADNTSIWHHMSDALFQSLYRVLSLLIAILPGILAFVVALGLFTLLGMGLSALLRRGLKAAKFDDRMTRERVGPDWSPSTSPTALIARTSSLHSTHHMRREPRFLSRYYLTSPTRSVRFYCWLPGISSPVSSHERSSSGLSTRNSSTRASYPSASSGSFWFSLPRWFLIIFRLAVMSLNWPLAFSSAVSYSR